MEFPVGNEKGRKLRSASEKKASQPVGRLLFTRREGVGDPGIAALRAYGKWRERSAVERKKNEAQREEEQEERWRR